MRVNALSKETFGIYGTLEGRDNALRPKERGIIPIEWGRSFQDQRTITHHICLEQVVEEIQFWWLATDTSCVVEPMEGLAVLAVAEEGEEHQPHYFLLDQSVQVEKNIRFNLVPLYDTSKANLFKFGEPLQKIVLSEAIQAVKPADEMDIGTVYTVFEQNKPADFSFSGEKHGFWEMTVTTQGTLFHEVDGRIFETKVGEVCLYGPDQHHRQWSSSEEGVKFYTLSFQLKMENSSWLSDQIFEADDPMLLLVEQIMKEYRSNAYGSMDLVQSYLKEILIRLIRSTIMKQTFKNSGDEVQRLVESFSVKTLIGLMESDIGRKWTLQELAGKVYVSQSYLSTVFKREMGESVMEWLNRIRMERAATMVVSRNQTITEIAECLGYSSIHYFSRVFKAWYGVSPSAYVKENRSGNK